MIFMIHIWLSFGINILVLQECACISLTMEFGTRDTFLPDNTFINNSANTLYHCIDICYRFNFCKSINFLRSARHCMLNNADTATVATVTKVGSFYMEKDQFPNELVPGVCVNHKCSTDELCVENNKCSVWLYIDCGEPVEDAGAIIEYTTTKAYSTAHYQCRRPPPLHSGIDDISCELSGQWTSRSIFKCPNTCYDPPQLHTEQIVKYHYESNLIYAHYSCSSFPDGTSTRNCPLSICTAPQTWTTASLSCSEVDCLIIGEYYTGNVDCTKTGRTCQYWNTNSPHKRVYTPPGNDRYTNYCRAFAGETTPWCYTTDPGRRWESCYVPLC